MGKWENGFLRDILKVVAPRDTLMRRGRSGGPECNEETLTILLAGTSSMPEYWGEPELAPYLYMGQCISFIPC